MSDDAPTRARAYLARQGWAGARLCPLQGDASSRSYFRAELLHARQVLLVEPRADGELSRPFLSIAAFLEAQGLGPPAVLDVAPELGLVALEDLGDRSLRRALEEAAGPAERRALFAAALAILVDLQTTATRALTADVHAWHVRFDRDVFRRELAMFRQRYLGDLAGLKPAVADERELDRALDWLSADLAGRTAVLTHRDYHIDNLYLTGGRLRLIDFQDARWGPAAYDPASLLGDRDVHRFLDPESRAGLVEDFGRARGLASRAFAAELALATVQRCLKATGTFADQALRRGRSHYLDYIPPTLARARAAALGFAPLEVVIDFIDRARAAKPGAC